MDFNGIRRLYLPLRPRARFSSGRKTQGQEVRPSAGLRPLIVSRVKCGSGPCRGHSVLPCAGNTICLYCAFMKGARFDIGLPETRSGATGPSPFKVRHNQRPERTMSGVRKPSPESSVPGETLNGGRRRNQFCRGYGSSSVLNEVSHEFSTAMRFEKCKRSPSEFIPAGFPSRQPSTRDGRLSQPHHHTGHGPFRTRPPNLR